MLFTDTLQERTFGDKTMENNEMIIAENSDVQGEIKTENIEKVEIIGVTFRSAGKIYYFDSNGVQANESSHVIVDTARGCEYGKVALSNRMVKVSELVSPLRKVIRKADKNDDLRYKINCEKENEAFTICNKMIADHKLNMKLIDVEYTFDNAKLLFYFTSDERVDFRELVKDLASVFRTRIELRQIGLRDETKIIGGYGICGREFCCHSFLGDFVQVSIKMAKEQNLSLNSSKISGACGRLMCCLRYEHDTYQEEIKKNPKIDSTVMTPDGQGTVIDVQTLAGLVKVRLDKDPDGPLVIYDRGLLRDKNGEYFVPGNGKASKASSKKKDEQNNLENFFDADVQPNEQEKENEAHSAEQVHKHKNKNKNKKNKNRNKAESAGAEKPDTLPKTDRDGESKAVNGNTGETQTKTSQNNSKKKNYRKNKKKNGNINKNNVENGSNGSKN